MNTSEKIRMLRIQKGLSQEALGQLVGVQRAAINKYEKGSVVNIKRSTLQKLATGQEKLQKIKAYIKHVRNVFRQMKQN